MADRRTRPLVTREPHGQVEVLSVHLAEIDQADTIEDLGRQIRRSIEASDASLFVLDLSGVRFLTSAAIGLLINLNERLAARDLTFALAGLKGDVAGMIENSRLDQLIPVYPSAKDAVDTLGRF